MRYVCAPSLSSRGDRHVNSACSLRFARLGVGEGQCKPEGAALALCALEADSAIVALDNLTADVEPQAQPGLRVVRVAYAAGALKACPDTLLLGVRDARPAVTYRHPRLATVHGQGHRNRCLGGRVADGVGQVVGDHLG